MLLFYGIDVPAADVSEWCGESEDGCWLDAALEGIRDAGFDVEELADDPEVQLRLLMEDEDHPPVIVTLMDPFVAVTRDHAVVVTAVTRTDDGTERVSFLDPATGRFEHDTGGRFWQCWDFAGQRAVIIRP